MFTNGTAYDLDGLKRDADGIVNAMRSWKPPEDLVVRCFVFAALSYEVHNDARFGCCDADADQADRSELGRVRAAHEADAR